MELALGVLGWSEAQFWGSTHYSLSCAYVGFCKYHKVGRWAQPDGTVGAPWTRDQVRQVRRQAVQIKEQFPDGELPKDLRRRVKAAKRR